MFGTNPMRKRYNSILADMILLRKGLAKLETNLKALQEECPHYHKTVVRDVEGADWNACDDCGKLLGH